MEKVFNSTFETSLRIMLLLSVCGYGITADRIAEYDLLTVYSRYFELSEQVLNGDNDFGFSEYAARRKSIQSTLKDMVLDGTVKVVRGRDGFQYAITEAGFSASKRMQSEYAVAYKKLAHITVQKFGNRTDSEIMDVINKASMKSLRR
ncbi:ABC-three component system middle component 2 [Anaeromicropila populeti]|uniref:Uncharacterized protein n=1 Tax=Anaeromicropila populeti TaxID=37658 RepID=A0A1I6LXX5_9FIRM|nr:ABC-three component system middle component 2 [Anaeromicropila populeti]SFS08280.1 hypothetical protein SAMN05661086_03653 [Anaeromicropila populeti]